MKQVFQDARSAEITVEEVPAPKLLAGCVLVRTAASVVSAGTERASSEFAGKNLLQKARMRPDLVRDVLRRTPRRMGGVRDGDSRRRRFTHCVPRSCEHYDGDIRPGRVAVSGTARRRKTASR